MGKENRLHEFNLCVDFSHTLDTPQCLGIAIRVVSIMEVSINDIAGKVLSPCSEVSLTMLVTDYADSYLLFPFYAIVDK